MMNYDDMQQFAEWQNCLLPRRRQVVTEGGWTSGWVEEAK